MWDVPQEVEGVDIVEHLNEQIPLDLEFTDSAGENAKLADYFSSEKPVVLVLNYYTCPQLCGLMLNGTVQSLREMEWVIGDNFEVVTVSIDPTEGPDLAAAKRATYLNAYDRNQWTDAERKQRREGAERGWHFLVGEESQIKALADAVGFQFKYQPDTGEYAHAAGIFVLTGDGTISRYLYGTWYEPETLQMSLLEAGRGKVGSTLERFILWCHQYDPNKGVYTANAMNIMRLGGALTLIAMILGFITLKVVERARNVGGNSDVTEQKLEGELQPWA